MEKFEFIGSPSGDGEQFCWDVDFDTFVRIKEEVPTKNDRAINFDPSDENDLYFDNLYRIYPDDLFHNHYEQRVTLVISEVFENMGKLPARRMEEMDEQEMEIYDG